MDSSIKTKVYDKENNVVGDVELPADVFGCEVNDAAIWAVVKAQRAGRRQGTHKTKKRGEVSGGGAKPFKQKGTGRARQGSSRSPLHVGGGTVFGPVPRDYGYRPPRSLRKTALKSILSMRAGDGKIFIIDSLELESARTKTVIELLSRFGLERALLVDVGNKHLSMSTRNLVGSDYLECNGLNVYDLMRFPVLILSKASVDVVVNRARGTQACDLEVGSED